MKQVNEESAPQRRTKSNRLPMRDGHRADHPGGSSGFDGWRRISRPVFREAQNRRFHQLLKDISKAKG